MRQHVAQVGFRVDVFQLGRGEEVVDGSGAFAGKEIILSTKRDRTQGLFGSIVVDLDETVLAIPPDLTLTLNRV